jgi:hypothetical protein
MFWRVTHVPAAIVQANPPYNSQLLFERASIDPFDKLRNRFIAQLTGVAAFLLLRYEQAIYRIAWKDNETRIAAC